jgi:2,3-bisphosphoglycerate-independent phosphoglycerate mutase
VLIRTSGRDVGLPAGIMGNSEVGHQNIGAGRVVAQEAVRLTEAIESGEFYKNPRLLGTVEHVKKTGGRLHLWGLCSNGVVHSMMEDVVALLDLAARNGLSRVFIHAMTDGRDTPPHSGIGYIGELEDAIKKYGVGRIASVIGRYYGMDRDRRWDRTAKAWNAMVHGRADHTAGSAKEAVLAAYDKNVTDEFIEPTVIVDKGRPVATVADGDAVLCFNFRGDRPRQLTAAFVDDAFDGFDRGRRPGVFYTAMTEYHQSLERYAAFRKPPKMKQIFGEYVSAGGLRQFRCAETEKFPHVTFFFDDYRDPPTPPTPGRPAVGPFPGEEVMLLQSPKGPEVPTYDHKPEMSAREVADAVLDRLKAGDPDCAIVNFANPDMVGHTGVLSAAVKAVETVDECQGRIIERVLALGGALVITADHGNCEQMIDDETGGPHTAHTTNPVRLYVVDERRKGATLREGGRLADIAPTMLELLGLPVPPEMTGKSLLPAK